MRDSLRSFGYLRKVNHTEGTVEAVISTGNIARDQMIIDPDGWDFANYNRNPVVLWGHDDNAMPLARTVEIEASPNELRATAQFDMEDEAAKRLLSKIERGFVNSTSVRWLPKRTEIRMLPTDKGEREVLAFVEQELLEWSFVSIPSDPGAVILRSNGETFDPDPLIQAAKGELPVPTTAEAVREHADAIQELLTRDLDPEAVALLRDLNARIAPVVTEPVVIATRKRDPVLDGLAAVTAAMERIAQQKPLDVDAMVASTLARVTGKTEERVRAELAGG